MMCLSGSCRRGRSKDLLALCHYFAVKSPITGSATSGRKLCLSSALAGVFSAQLTSLKCITLSITNSSQTISFLTRLTMMCLILSFTQVLEKEREDRTYAGKWHAENMTKDLCISSVTRHQYTVRRHSTVLGQCNSLDTECHWTNLNTKIIISSQLTTNCFLHLFLEDNNIYTRDVLMFFLKLVSQFPRLWITTDHLK